MENLINELKKAKHEAGIGGIFHSMEFKKVEEKIKDFIKSTEFNIKKPEYLHYNSITTWYYENKTYLDSVNVL